MQSFWLVIVFYLTEYLFFLSQKTQKAETRYTSLYQVYWHNQHHTVKCEAHVIYWFLRSYATYHEFRLKTINIISALFHFYTPFSLSYCPLLLLLLLFPVLIIAIPTILLTILTFPILTIRYLQLWNPLHQCQSGQPHRWVQRCPLQEVHGSDRSRGGWCAWGGAPEHHSMTYHP